MSNKIWGILKPNFPFPAECYPNPGHGKATYLVEGKRDLYVFFDDKTHDVVPSTEQFVEHAITRELLCFHEGKWRPARDTLIDLQDARNHLSSLLSNNGGNWYDSK